MCSTKPRNIVLLEVTLVNLVCCLCSRELSQGSLSNVHLLILFQQLNISFPATGCQKLIEVDDERKLRTFYEKRMATEVPADPLGDEWKVSTPDHYTKRNFY